MPQLGIDDSRPASASGVPRVASSEGIRKAIPLMKRKELAVTNSDTTMTLQRTRALSTAGPPSGISPCFHNARLPEPLPRVSRLRRMRLGRIASPDGVAFVSIEGESDDPTGMIALEIAEHPFGTPTFTGRSWPLADVRLLAPMLASKVVCIGKNYADHIAEMGGLTGPAPADPVIFLKPNTAIIG